jgi:hypothetical protein
LRLHLSPNYRLEHASGPTFANLTTNAFTLLLFTLRSSKGACHHEEVT